MKTLIESTHPSSDSPPPPRANTLALLGGLLALSALSPAPAWAAAEPITPCTAEPTSMTLAPGDVIDCALDVDGDEDYFTFAGVANARMVVSISANEPFWCWYDHDHPNCPWAVVRNPDNTVLMTVKYEGYGATKVVTLPSSGTYSVTVKDNDGYFRPPPLVINWV